MSNFKITTTFLNKIIYIQNINIKTKSFNPKNKKKNKNWYQQKLPYLSK